MDDEKLIELVRSHPVLYDLGEARYLDSRHKTVIWNKIAAELEAEANDCKSRWSNIRDQYRKSLKKETTRSGQAATQIRPYKYKHLLRFLKPTFEERATMSNIEPEEPVDDSWTEPAGEEEITMQEEPITKPSRKPKAQSKRRGRSTEPSASSQLMKYLISKKRSEQSDGHLHPVDAFLSGIAPILKSLDPLNLNKARAEINATVQKYELAMLMQESPSNCQTLPQTSSNSIAMCPTPPSVYRISSPLWSPPRNPSPLQNPSPPRYPSPLRNFGSPRKSTPTSRYALSPPPLQNPSPPRFTSPLRNRSSPRKSTPTSRYAPSPPLKIPPLRPAKPRALTPPPPQEKHPDKKPIENHSISFSYNDFFKNFKFNMNEL
ncbi:uncharacterized protein LOC129725138 [Wyeomyia smithii]|uniref:uncharacterized protein LOC129725138 n=1 Tax=Wyeomyia smithii TaxID=174621 RepID=UPI002467E198|nr:uncharacterized protein LOC129725138 [Wyeomyia smithii]